MTHPASLPPAMQVLVERLLAFVAQDGCSDDEFDAMALALFAFQHANNEPFRRFCQRRGTGVRKVAGWRDIPPVPIGAFKDATLSCVPVASCERVFMTSGTTRGDVRGRHHHPTLAVWDRSMLRNFARRFMQGVERLPMGVLFPSERELPHSSLARYLALAVETFGSGASRHLVGPAGIDVDGACRMLEVAVREAEPVVLLGAGYSFVHLLDELARRGLSYVLPAGSRILDTGGLKGQSRVVSPDEFYGALGATFGVAADACIGMYGMTELSTQFYDAGNASRPSVKSGPHWIRSRVLDPLTGRELPAGARGVLAHCDLASFNSVTTILTEDVGVAVDGGFHLLGRVEGAEARGCSLAMQEFVQAAGAP